MLLVLAMANDRLGPLDSLFLYLEKKEMPLHIGSVFVLDGTISLDGLKALIEAKLPLIPRYRQRVVFPPFQAGYPTWEFDPEFDINGHIRGIHLERGTLECLERLSGHLFGEVMDRNRPLWDLTLVDGLDDGKSAVIARVHHCLVDGVAGVALMNLIMDTSPEVKPLPPQTPYHAAAPSPDWAVLADSMVSSYFHAVERVLSVQSAVLDVAGKLFGGWLAGSVPVLSSAAEVLPPAQHFPFFAPAAGPRKVSWTEFPMSDVNAMRHLCGVKVNDVGMLILAGAMRRYAKLHHQSVKDRLLRLMVPVNRRNGDPNQGLGNKITLAPVNIPLDIADPVKLLANIHQRTEAVKHAYAGDLTVLAGSLLALMPVPMQAQLAGTLSNQVPVLPFDMVATNVAGPDHPLYLLGREILTYYPYVPIGDFMGVCCAMASYNGTFYFSLTGDCASAPDLDLLRDFLNQAFVELHAALGLAKPIEPAPEPAEEAPSPEILESVLK
jgi:diacylglycerol O-acyltransferase / wax synthase